MAFILGVAGAAPLGILLSLVALSQLKKRPQGGRRLAMGGLAFSLAWLLVVTAGVVLIVVVPDRGGTAQITGGSAVSSFDLAPGDCLNDLEESEGVSSVPTVPCAQPHHGEVFATFELTETAWPGDAALAKQAEDGCVKHLGEYSAKAASDEKLEIYFLHPTERSWADGDREVTCVAMDPTGRRTGSIRD